jgi:hypothetical protein
MNLVDAVRGRHLVHWYDRGFVRTVEPHLFAQFRGLRLVLVAYQIAGGPTGEREQCWKVIDIGDGLNVEPANTFECNRAIPQHLREQAQRIYASAGPLPP